MKIEILGGKNEIGGNKILIEHKGTKILLDFGMSFNQSNKFFSEFLQPRKGASLTDFYEFGLLPDIKGAYREDYLRHLGKEKEEREIDAVFLSHAHIDHCQYIHFLRTDISIYCTKPTKIILQALEETGSSTFSDFITSCESFLYYINTKGGLSKIDRRKKEYIQNRLFNTMEPYEKVKIGSLEIEMVPVDHSLPGSCGFIIYSDSGNIVYTGDIRFHGSNQELSRKFVERAKAAHPRWLLCEGTRINQDKGDSEDEVKKKISEIISHSEGLVFVEHPIRDIDRVNSIFKATKENDRTFVINPKLAYLIEELGDLSPIKLGEVKILLPLKEWGIICKNKINFINDAGDINSKEVDRDIIEKEYSDWEKDFIFRDNTITYKELAKNPSKYVVSMSMWEIKNLIDICPKNAIWIKSSCEPFSDEMEIDEERKQNWLNHFNVKQYFAHASGHASGNEIREMIKEINPKKLITIHTEHPRMFKRKEIQK